MRKNQNMQDTPFINFHRAAGAKILPFAGFNMPIQFKGINIEHETVRNGVGIFDISHMGEFWVKGPNAFKFIQKLTSNDVSLLQDGRIQYTCFPNETNGIIDDLLLYKFDSETYLMVVNASNIKKDWNWCSKQALSMGMQVGKELYNASDEIAALAIQGPDALKSMQKLTSFPITEMKPHYFNKIDFAGIHNLIFATSGYTGEKGCEIYIAKKDANTLMNAVLEAGKEFNIQPIGLGARDTLRLEMGYCLYGNDINETTSPLEAGLNWITKFVDGNEFINRVQLEKQKKAGIHKLLRGFEMTGIGIPRQHYEICDMNGNTIGEVTSGTMSPSMKKGIGMGYIKYEHADIGKTIFIKIREKLFEAVIVKFPIFKKKFY